MVLCKTYKKDQIFASSISKLLVKLEDELISERAKLEKTEEKKKSYKHLARQFHGDGQNALMQQRHEFEAATSQL